MMDGNLGIIPPFFFYFSLSQFLDAKESVVYMKYEKHLQAVITCCHKLDVLSIQGHTHSTKDPFTVSRIARRIIESHQHTTIVTTSISFEGNWFDIAAST